jgi:two-component system KDP operon response regulator KdpE
MNLAPSHKKILIVDDDIKLTSFIARQLRAHDYRVDTAFNGEEGLRQAGDFRPNLIVLDLSMPVLDGLHTLMRLREWFDGPIIILSGIDEERKKVEALDLGADDYLTKPFGMEELLARVRSSLRRTENAGVGGVRPDVVVQSGDVRIDLTHRTVTREGQEVLLTRTEYELLKVMASNVGKVLTHRELLREVWGPEYGEETEYLRTFVKQLRRKLEKNPSRPSLILTQPGLGYRLVAD